MGGMCIQGAYRGSQEYGVQTGKMAQTILTVLLTFWCHWSPSLHIERYLERLERSRGSSRPPGSTGLVPSLWGLQSWRLVLLICAGLNILYGCQEDSLRSQSDSDKMANKTLQGRNPEFSISVTTEETKELKKDLWAVWGGPLLSWWNDEEIFAFSPLEGLASMSGSKKVLKKELSGYGYSSHGLSGGFRLQRKGREETLSFVVPNIFLSQKLWSISYA